MKQTQQTERWKKYKEDPTPPKKDLKKIYMRTLTVVIEKETSLNYKNILYVFDCVLLDCWNEQ